MQLKTYFLKKMPYLAMFSLVLGLSSCGSYQYVGVENDGIYGSFNCIYFDHKTPLILPFNERNEKKMYKSKIFGPTCDSIDLIANEIMLPELVIGEWVYVENFGAYTTAASSSFNGFITTDYKYILRN